MYNINNYESIKKLLSFPSEQKDKGMIYYFLQVIRRRKDNPELDISEVQIGVWYITSQEYLNNIWPIIKSLCDNFNARAYISLTPRSMKKLGIQCLMEYAKRISDGNFYRIQSIPSKMALGNDVIQSRGIIKKSRWVLDIDYLDKEFINKTIDMIKSVTIIQTMHRTPGGYHVIIESFNPANLETVLGLHKLQGRNDYLDDSGKIIFTLIMECNTVLYA